MQNYGRMFTILKEKRGIPHTSSFYILIINYYYLHIKMWKTCFSTSPHSVSPLSSDRPVPRPRISLPLSSLHSASSRSSHRPSAGRRCSCARPARCRGRRIRCLTKSRAFSRTHARFGLFLASRRRNRICQIHGVSLCQQTCLHMFV